MPPKEAELYVILDIINPEFNQPQAGQTLLGSDFVAAGVENQFFGYNFLLSGQVELPSTCQ